MRSAQTSLFGEQRLNLERAIELTAESLNLYGQTHDHWAIAFSGGKDSTTVLTVVAYLIKTGRIVPPKSLRVLYADTRLELPPLWQGAMDAMAVMREFGAITEVVLPALDDRFFVYMFGRGVPPPSNTFRWCTAQMKVEPMEKALTEARNEIGQKFLMLTGVRIGESAARDQRIAVACSKDGAECGQGWFQVSMPDDVADTLAPILHWRSCLVWDWLAVGPHGFRTAVLAHVYGADEDGSEFENNARTGCVGCNLASRDQTLDRLVTLRSGWAYLAPLQQLRVLYAALKLPKNRKRHIEERKKDGTLSSNPQRMGPLTLEARRWGLSEVRRIEREVNDAAGDMPRISLINDEEYARILELIDANTWPQGWTGEEPNADEPLPFHYGRKGAVKQFLLEMEVCA